MNSPLVVLSRLALIATDSEDGARVPFFRKSLLQLDDLTQREELFEPCRLIISDNIAGSDCAALNVLTVWG